MAKAEPAQCQREATRALLAEYRKTHSTAIRDELVALHTDLVRYIAARFAHRGESFEDLYQVGCLALIHAIERYDPDRGTEFSTFATPTVVGEIKRYFRDRGWAIKVPRRLQELKANVNRVADTYASANGRTATVTEIATTLSVTEDEVLEAQELASASVLLSLDAMPEKDDGGGASLLERVGVDDAALQNVEDHVALERAVATLPPREQLVIHLRYYRSMSQSDIARILGISKMHVSRLQARALEHLKSQLTEADTER